jgi:two-component system, OmpR family, alkaline phosphatase synthesis response regulator PhoP
MTSSSHKNRDEGQFRPGNVYEESTGRMPENSLAMEDGGKVSRVLVVDDDPDVVAICSLVLESEGYEVAAALNGSEAVDKVKKGEGEIDVVLLDVMMPVIDGLTVCKMVKRDPRTRDLPVIIMSASEVLREKGVACHADAVIPKPFDIDRLVDTVGQFAQA